MAGVRCRGCKGELAWGAVVVCFLIALSLHATAAKPTAGFTISLAFKECTPKPASQATLRLTFSSVLPVSKARIRFEQAGDPASKQSAPRQFSRQELESITPGKTYDATARVPLPEAGRVEYRGWVESLDADGNVVVGQSTSLYVVVTPKKVLSGPGSFETVELVELKRRRDAKEITPDEYEQRAKALTGRKLDAPSEKASNDDGTGDAVANTSEEIR